MEHEILAQLKTLIERKYGDLSNETGCYVNGRWLSVRDIAALIDQVDTEF